MSSGSENQDTGSARRVHAAPLNGCGREEGAEVEFGHQQRDVNPSLRTGHMLAAAQGQAQQHLAVRWLPGHPKEVRGNADVEDQSVFGPVFPGGAIQREAKGG